MKKKTDPQTIRQTYQLACISEYTTDIRYLQGKANVVADALSRPNDELLEANSIDQPDNQVGTLPPAMSGTATIPSCVTSPKNDPSASSTLSSSHSNAAARAEAAKDDLECVVNAITTLGIDWNDLAAQQALDPDFRRIRADARSGLQFKKIDIGRTSLVVDISNGPARPFIPLAFRKPVFDAIHGLGHPGVERTRQSVRSKVVWPTMSEDVSRWHASASHANAPKSRATQYPLLAILKSQTGVLTTSMWISSRFRPQMASATF